MGSKCMGNTQNRGIVRKNVHSTNLRCARMEIIMNEFQLKYGCNPNQKPSRIFMADGSELPVEILKCRPG